MTGNNITNSEDENAIKAMKKGDAFRKVHPSPNLIGNGSLVARERI